MDTEGMTPLMSHRVAAGKIICISRGRSTSLLAAKTHSAASFKFLFDSIAAASENLPLCYSPPSLANGMQSLKFGLQPKKKKKPAQGQGIFQETEHPPSSCTWTLAEAHQEGVHVYPRGASPWKSLLGCSVCIREALFP